jgi:predicted DsbA family dithiol-disulfide isomerase
VNDKQNSTSEDRKVRITVWSDYVCPFCYLEEPVLEQIRREYGDAVNVQWRAFELRPAPVPTLDPDGEYLHSVWNRAVYPMARKRQMTLRLPPVQPRSRKALELAEFARAKGRFDETHRALFKAFFEHGQDLDDTDVLVRIASDVGLDAEEARAALDQGTYRAAVIQSEREAQQLGLTAVPTLMINAADEPLEAAEIISGAQPGEVVKAAIERALR